MCQERSAIETEEGTPQSPSENPKISPRQCQVLDMNLLQASEVGDFGVATDLIGKGANVNGTDATGKTPLHIAAFAGHHLLAKALLEAGADTKARDNLDKTPLHHAATRSNKKITKQLLAAGCDIEARDKWGKTPLHLVADCSEGGGKSAEGALAIMILLLKAGAKTDVLDAQGKTALHMTAQKGHREFTNLLISGGADVHIQDLKCKTALHGASRSATLTLLDYSADPEAADIHGRTALHEAAMSANTDVAGALIAAGANVNAKDKKSSTPLDLASRNGKWAMKSDLGGRTIVSLLKSHGGVPGKRVGPLACFSMF